MPLPHFNNIKTAVEKWEPIHKNLFECTFILPTPLQDDFGTEATHLLLENALKVTLPSYPDLPTVQQRFKYSTRVFVLVPETTSLDNVEIDFNLNQNEQHEIFVWNMMKSWYDLAWNNENGVLNYKKNMTGDIVVHVHDREGHVVRRVTYHNAQMVNFSGWEEADWEANTEIVSLKAKFAVDYWEDYYYTPQFARTRTEPGGSPRAI